VNPTLWRRWPGLSGTSSTSQGTLTIDSTPVVVNGKTENAQPVIALDPFTLEALRVLVDQLKTERPEFGTGYRDHGLLFCRRSVHDAAVRAVRP
jgi:hypothetical protein